MNWIEILYPMMAAASLTLGLIHLVVWLERRRDYDYLLFVLIAVSVAAFSLFELLSIETSDATRFGELQRYAAVPITTLMIAMVAYVRVRFGAGNRALGGAVVALRLFALVAGFAGPVNAHFTQILEMRPLELWGGVLAYTPIGVPNPVTWVVRAANLLLVLYVLGATREIRRRVAGPERRSALLVCGSMAFFLAVSATQTALVTANVLHLPYLVNPVFVVVVLMMSYDLGGELVRAALTSRRLVESEEQLFDSEMRVALAAEATGLGLWSWDVGRDRVWISDNGRALFDLREEQAITFGRFLALLHPDDRERVQQAIHRSLIEGIAFLREHRIVRPDGGVRWIQSRGPHQARRQRARDHVLRHLARRHRRSPGRPPLPRRGGGGAERDAAGRQRRAHLPCQRAGRGNVRLHRGRAGRPERRIAAARFHARPARAFPRLVHRPHVRAPHGRGA
jgi:PAS domain-containing protein